MMPYLPPKFLAVLDPTNCNFATPVVCDGDVQAAREFFVAAATTAAYSTAAGEQQPTLRTVATAVFDDIDLSTCDVALLQGVVAQSPTDVDPVTAMKINQGTYTVFVDSADQNLVEDGSIERILECVSTCPIPGQITNDVRVFPGSAHVYCPTGLCPMVFLSRENSVTVQINLPADINEDIRLLVKLCLYRYTINPTALGCLLQPILMPAPGAPAVLLNDCIWQRLAALAAPVGISPTLAAEAPGLPLPMAQGIEATPALRPGPFQT